MQDVIKDVIAFAEVTENPSPRDPPLSPIQGLLPGQYNGNTPLRSDPHQAQDNEGFCRCSWEMMGWAIKLGARDFPEFVQSTNLCNGPNAPG